MNLAEILENWVCTNPKYNRHFTVIKTDPQFGCGYIKHDKTGSIVGYILTDSFETYEKAVSARVYMAPEIYKASDPKFLEQFEKHLKTYHYFSYVSYPSNGFSSWFKK